MSWIDGLRHRLHVWRDRDAYYREQAEERRFHREMELLHWNPERARPGFERRASTCDFIVRHRNRERSMALRFLNALQQDLGYAIRGLIRSPGFALMAVATLALGVGANAAVFSVLDRLFGQPPAGVGEPETLRRLYLRIPEPSEPVMIAPSFNYPAFSAVEGELEPDGAVAAWTSSDEETIRTGDSEVPVRASWVTHDYFDVLNVNAARGRLFGEEEGRVNVPVSVAVISHDFWERFFASDPGVLGRTLAVSGADYTVVGVAAEGFTGLDLDYTDVFLPLGTFPVQTWSGDPWWETGGNYLQVVTRLPEGAADEQLAARATAGFHRQVVPERYLVLPATTVVPGSIIAARGVGARAGTSHANQAVSLSKRIAGVSLIVLLIAGANVAGLLLVRAHRRRHELAVRRALGISRARLASQFLTEGMVLTALAAAAAVPLAGWGGAALRRLLLPEVQWARGPLDLRAVLFALGSAAVVGLLAATMPALQSWGGRMGTGLKVTSREGGGRGAALRSGLLAGQAALAVILLMGAGLFVRSLENVGALRLGFDADRLAWVDIRGTPTPTGPELREIAARFASFGGVSGTAMARSAPMTGAAFVRLFLPGRDSLPVAPGESPAHNAVSPEFFDVTGMRVLEGRTFARNERSAVVVSETMARMFWPGESAVGKCIMIGTADSTCQQVVGVVEDSRRRAIIEEPMPQYFLPLGDAMWGVILLRVQPGRWDAVANAIRDQLAGRYEPGDVVLRRSMEMLEPQLRPWRLGAQLFTAFGLLALLVTIVGVYSVMAYAVSQRTHELGVRMALGARAADLLALVVGSGVRVVAVGVAIGIAISLALGRIVESLLYDVSPWDPISMAWSAGILLATGVAASVVPAWRAGRVDPAETLRPD